MKTTLPERSLIIKERLDRIVQEILAVGKKEIAMIILFGSYARGDWVMDSYVKGHITYSYESDLDIMVITKSSKFGGAKGGWLEQKIEERLERVGLSWKPFSYPSVNLVVETIQRVNKELEKSQYFFSDIKQQGILLYDSKEFTLAKPRELNWEERKEIAKEDFQQGLPYGNGLLRDSKNTVKYGELKLGAFYLHQATESFYNTILLVFSGYKPKWHNIQKLSNLAKNYSSELLTIFPRDTKEQRDSFVLLQKAYIDARYNKNYKITEEQLLYLISRVEKLKAITEEICQAWINKTVT